MYNKISKIDKEIDYYQELYEKGKCTRKEFIDKLNYLFTCANFLKHSEKLRQREKTKSSH